MKTYRIDITGVQPLLMHADDIEWADQMTAWKDDARNKKTSKAGDDRSPAWRWIGGMYNDGEYVVMPAENLMRCLMEGGAMVPVPGAKGSKTFKAQTQSGMLPTAHAYPLLIANRPIKFAPFAHLMHEADFATHKTVAEANGFSLFLKRAKIGTSKHVRVRPRFDNWGFTAEMIVTDEQITQTVLQEIVTFAGQYKGLGDWRPGGKTPGPFGMFRGVVSLVK